MQGHGVQECRVLYPEVKDQEQDDQFHEEAIGSRNTRIHRPQKGNARILSSGKMVGDPGNWNVVRNKQRKVDTEKQNTKNNDTEIRNSFDVLNKETIHEDQNSEEEIQRQNKAATIIENQLNTTDDNNGQQLQINHEQTPRENKQIQVKNTTPSSKQVTTEVNSIKLGEEQSTRDWIHNSFGKSKEYEDSNDNQEG